MWLLSWFTVESVPGVVGSQIRSNQFVAVCCEELWSRLKLGAKSRVDVEILCIEVLTMTQGLHMSGIRGRADETSQVCQPWEIPRLRRVAFLSSTPTFEHHDSRDAPCKVYAAVRRY